MSLKLFATWRVILSSLCKRMKERTGDGLPYRQQNMISYGNIDKGVYLKSLGGSWNFEGCSVRSGLLALIIFRMLN